MNDNKECEVVKVTILNKTTGYCRTHKEDVAEGALCPAVSKALPNYGKVVFKTVEEMKKEYPGPVVLRCNIKTIYPSRGTEYCECSTHSTTFPINRGCPGVLGGTRQSISKLASPALNNTPKTQFTFDLFQDVFNAWVTKYYAEPKAFLIHEEDWVNYQYLFFDNPNRQGTDAFMFNGIPVYTSKSVIQGTVQCR